METQVRTPHAVFMMPQRLLVPLFQRPYVWNEERQWEPLWKDVIRVAERLLNDPSGVHQPHFLGAVVLQQMQSQAGDLQQRTVIDGQQRLTTLQLMLDAIQGELIVVGAEAPAARLEQLVENGKAFRRTPEDTFKIWPTNRDRDAFNDVMGAPFPIKYSTLPHREHRLVQAHQFFAENCRGWLKEAGEDQILSRAEILERAVRELLQMVVIDLAPQENAQEIFETLNARGAILTASDLIKNFIFQRLLERGSDVEKAYATYWQDFETTFWEEEVTVGRIKTQRSSLFINQWLIYKIGEEVLAREVFSRFKVYADFEAGLPMPELLGSLHKAATSYKAFVVAGQNQESDIDEEGLFSYRLKVLESEAARPLVMYLRDELEGVKDKQVLENCYNIIESWLIRRMLLRVTTKRYNQIFPEAIQSLRKSKAPKDDALREFFAGQTADTSFWPDNEEITLALNSEKIYGYILQSRVRMVYEAVEDYFRGWIDGETSKAGSRARRGTFAIEHVMPQAWRSHWALPEHISDYERDRTVQKFGNLTLLTTKLNSSVSNAPWSEKKVQLHKHDLLQLNRKLLEEAGEDWTDEKIDHRSAELTSVVFNIWPAPEKRIRRQHEEVARTRSTVTVSDLIEAGYVAAGQKLLPRYDLASGRFATILPDGRIEVEGQIKDSLSLAGGVVNGRIPNGWNYWLLDAESKRSMKDLRGEYESTMGLELSSDLDEPIDMPSVED